MLSYVSIITGVFQTFCSGNNVGHISRRIGRGQLEHMLIQPNSMSLQLLSEGFLPFTGSGNLMVGIVLLSISIQQLGLTLTWWWVLSLLGNILMTMTIILAQSYLFSSAAFYAPVAAEEISSTVINMGGDLSQYPLSGMHRTVQLSLVTVLPTGLMGWFPSLSLLGKPPMNLPEYYPVIVALLFFIAAKMAFKKGMNHYVRSGSNRYLPYGHRR